MAVRTVRLFGDPVLTQPSVQVVDYDRELRRLVTDLADTMHELNGAGLAAPQIGVGLRVFTYDVEGTEGHLINPELIESSAEQQDGDEGCLSFPGLYFPCVRARRVLARGFTAHGEPVTIDATDLMARCVAHEIDHLDGVLFVDRLDRATRKLAMRAVREAEWFGAGAPAEPPRVKVSPHATGGLGR